MTERTMLRRLLFVCSGNICRSPAAEALARDELRRQNRDDVIAESCGTLGIVGEPAAPYTLRALRERGIDLETFRSRAMSYFLLREADLVIGMETYHRDAARHELGGDLDLVPGGVRGITECHPDERHRDDAGIYDFVQEPWPEYSEGIAELEGCVRCLVKELFGEVRIPENPG